MRIYLVVFESKDRIDFDRARIAANDFESLVKKANKLASRRFPAEKMKIQEVHILADTTD